MRTVIKKWGINGEGIAYDKKKAIFIPGAIPNEEVEYHIVKDNKTFAIGELDRIITKSSQRRFPLCSKWLDCGGCSLMPVQYKGQCKMKEQVLKEGLMKYAGYKGKINPLMKNPNPLAYRNSCKLPFGYKDGVMVTGMYERDTNHFIPLERCFTHSKHVERVRQEVEKIVANEKVYDKRFKEGYRTLVIKEFNEKVQIIFVTGKNRMKQNIIDECSKIENVVSIWQSQKIEQSTDLYGKRMFHLFGEEKLNVTLNDLTLTLLPRSFFQLNTQQACNLYAYVESIVPKCRTIVEAYSGIGAISLFVKDKADQIIGIESVQDAVDNANENARKNAADNVNFICGDAGLELQSLVKKAKIDTLIVDPPRVGLDETMKETILNSTIKTIVYVSCNPSTLSKDLKELQKGYKIQSVQPFDMFSQTSHVETVVLLSRVNITK